MGISIYYSARRGKDVTEGERTRLDQIVADENRRLLTGLDRKLATWKERGVVPPEIGEAREICEGLHLDRLGHDRPDAILEGSSKVSHGACGDEVMYEQLQYYMDVALGRLRQALPDAEWRVHIDDIDLEWDDELRVYVFPSSP